MTFLLNGVFSYLHAAMPPESMGEKVGFTDHKVDGDAGTGTVDRSGQHSLTDRQQQRIETYLTRAEHYLETGQLARARSYARRAARVEEGNEKTDRFLERIDRFQDPYPEPSVTGNGSDKTSHNGPYWADLAYYGTASVAGAQSGPSIRPELDVAGGTVIAEQDIERWDSLTDRQRERIKIYLARAEQYREMDRADRADSYTQRAVRASENMGGRVVFTDHLDDRTPEGDKGFCAESEEARKSWADRVSLSGYLRTRYYYKNKDKVLGPYFETRNDARIEALVSISESAKAVVSGDGRYHVGRGKSESYDTLENRIDLWEAYVNMTFDKLDLKVGQQIIRWGKSDELNPTDVFTPEDLSEFMNHTSRVDRKIPVPAVKANYYLDRNNINSIELIWIPVFVPDRVAEAGRDQEPYSKRAYHSLGLVVDTSRRPDRWFTDSSFAAKWQYTGDRVDLSASYSYHYNQFPAYHLFIDQGKVLEKYHRQHTIGGDFETVVGKIGLRGEAAYTTGKRFINVNPADADRIYANDSILAVVGADYTFPRDLYVNLQYSFKYLYGYKHLTIEQRHSDSIMWNVSKSFMRDKLTVGTLGRYFLSRLDCFFEVSASYEFTEAWIGTVGFHFYDGDEDMLFGQAYRNDQIFVILEYIF